MLLRQFWRNLRKQKIRTMLPVLGIMWGTVAVVLLLGMGRGLHMFVEKGMRGIGENIAIIWPGRTTKAFMGMGKGRRIRLREEDAELLRSRIPLIESISPEYSRNTTARIPGNPPLDVGISGVLPEWGDMRNIYPQPGGRFLNESDLLKRRRVVFLGNELKDDLFGDRDAVGKIVSIQGVPFLVIGVMQKKIQNASYTSRDEGRAVIPTSTFTGLYGHKYVNNFICSPVDPGLMSQTTKSIYRVMGEKYMFDPEDKDALFVWDTTEMREFFDNFFMVFRLFLAFVASLTLVVGGISVANIMNVMVEERRSEIGIKMAVGAHRNSILMNFLGEALLFSGIGGFLGFIISFTFFKLIVMIPQVLEHFGTPEMSVLDGIVAVSILLIVALTAGYFPAKRAAWMNPLEAIKK